MEKSLCNIFFPSKLKIIRDTESLIFLSKKSWEAKFVTKNCVFFGPEQSKKKKSLTQASFILGDLNGIGLIKSRFLKPTIGSELLNFERIFFNLSTKPKTFLLFLKMMPFSHKNMLNGRMRVFHG